MERQFTPVMKLMHLQDYNRKLMRDQKRHVIRRMCQDSNWPFTGDLTPQEIVCMRDTYCGKRRFPSYVEKSNLYDSVHYPKLGWNQGANKDTRENVKGCQYSARAEDEHRIIPVEGNSVYGHNVDSFFDFTAGDHAHMNICQRQFYRGNTIISLPPLRKI